MQLQLAQQQAAAGAQELYANGYADAAAAAAASSSAKQMAPPRQSSTDYRLVPSTLDILLVRDLRSDCLGIKEIFLLFS